MAYFPMAFLYFKQSSETWLVCAFAFYLPFLFLRDSCMAGGITINWAIFSGSKKEKLSLVNLLNLLLVNLICLFLYLCLASYRQSVRRKICMYFCFIEIAA